MEIDYKLELKNFLDDKDRLTKYPSKHRLKIYTLFYLAQQFEDNKEYTEKEVNELINNILHFCIL